MTLALDFLPPKFDAYIIAAKFVSGKKLVKFRHIPKANLDNNVCLRLTHTRTHARTNTLQT